MTLKSACLVVLLSLLPVVVRAQDTRESKPLTVMVAPSAEDYSKEPYIFELIQNKVRFEADGKGQRELTIRARVQSESAVRELGLLTYSFASGFESLDVVYVRVRKPDGSVVETPPSDVQELDSAVSREAPMYSDEREKHVAVKSLTVGDVLEAQLRWTVHDAIAKGQFWFEYSFFREGICLKETVEVNLPRTPAAKVESKDVKPKIEESGDRRIYTLQTANVKKAEKPKIPEWERNFYGLDPPDVRVSSFASWADIGTWFEGLLEPKMAVTPEIRSKAEEVTKGLTGEDEKIRALYDFVSTRFRYIGVDLGVGRYAPHAAGDILANRYGDCKDKHTLFAALLKSVGISAYPALISSRFRVDPALPSLDLFDHVITVIPKGDSFIFLDTTPEVAPYGLLLANLRDREALVMPGGAPARLVKTPAEPPFKSHETVSIDSSIDSEGTLDATMKIEARGDGEIGLRAAYRATAQNRWDELTQALVNQMGFAGKSSDISVGRPEDTSQPFVISFHYHRTDFPDWKSQRISFPAPYLALMELTDEQKLSKKALPLGSMKDVTYESTVKLPKDYSVVAPENVSRKTEFAEFSAEYSAENGGILRGKIHWKTLEREVPGDKRGEYVELAKTIEELQQRYIPIQGKFSQAQGAPTNVLAAIFTSRREMIPQLEKAAEALPDNENIAIMLADAYSKNGRAKDAVPLLEKRLAVDPDSPRLMLALGEAYLATPDANRPVDKATELLKKGLGKNAEPMALNNVAYALAEAKVNLSDAESYSERAVERISEETTKVEAGDTDKEDFQLMLQLAMYWDTLGWVKFQMGDIENAEKYVAASWDLLQDAVVGEHLVEIYEKQGKRQRAAVICLMAQAGFAHEEVYDKLSEEMKTLRPLLSTQAGTTARKPPQDGAMALSDLRTLPVPFQTKLAGNSRSATVVIALTSGSKEAEVSFVSGAEELHQGKAALEGLKYPQSFPDNRPARVVRKGIFSCSVYTKDCLLVLMQATDAAVSDN